MRFAKLMMVAMVVFAAAPLQAQTSDDETVGNAALAERLTQLAQTAVSAKAIVPATLRESAALLEAANKLAPGEPRFLRLLTEAYLQLGGDEGRTGAISSLTRYRALVPDDVVAQIRLIDLYYSQQQSASDCKKYLEQLIGAETVSPEVKAHVYVMAARLARERSESDRSKLHIEQALQLFPLSPEALKMEYEQLDANTPAAKRVSVLLQMIRSNPVQPGAMTEVASEAAAVGLVDPSLIWYQTNLTLSQRMGMAVDYNQAKGYAAELIVAGQLRLADALVKKLLEQNPTDSDVTVMALLVARRNGAPDDIQMATDQLRTALQARLSRTSDAVNGKASSATSQPSGQADIASDVKKLSEANNQNLTSDYAGTLAQLAFLEIYFNGKSADAQQYVNALGQLVPSDNVALTRLQGWSYLIDGKKDEAKVKLSAVADRDPLSGLGMIRIESAELSPDQVTADARKLLMANPSGVMGALLIEGLRDRVSIVPQSADAQDVHAELDKFPTGWLDFVDPQKVKLMYSLKAEPLRVAHSFGEPILARVTISNSSNYDITIGSDGAIRPDVWVDAQVRGIGQQYMAGVAIDRLGQKVVLHPKDSISQVLRADQDGLGKTLNNNPSVEVPLYLSVLTNPITVQAGIVPGPGGYRMSFTKVVERASSPLSDSTIQQMYNQLVSGTPDARMHAIELLGTYVRAIRAQGDDKAKNKAAEMAEMVHKSTGDPLSAVRAEATFVSAVLSEPGAAETMLRNMLADQAFTQRVFGLAILPMVVQPDKQKQLAAPLAKDDPDPIIKQLAASMV
ncbi:MAG TPA: hypothetical protein VKK61_08600, partial [Tepidisphaeraceae bacterium]|nr:hypothetical protein [Tepidisphaeraceae bacterium]